MLLLLFDEGGIGRKLFIMTTPSSSNFFTSLRRCLFFHVIVRLKGRRLPGPHHAMNKSAKRYQFVTTFVVYYAMGGGGREEEKIVENARVVRAQRAYLSCQLRQSRATQQQMNVMLPIYSFSIETLLETILALQFISY